MGVGNTAVNPLFLAAQEVQHLCEGEGWDFCFIGGLAVQRWGEPRHTRDVDLTLLTGFGAEGAYVARLLERLPGRVDDPGGFALRARVVLLRNSDGVPLDVALGALPFETRSVHRSSVWRVPGVDPLRTCGAEDLVVHKVFAGRDRDWADVRGIVDRQGARLDWELIESEPRLLLELKETPEAWDRRHALR